MNEGQASSAVTLGFPLLALALVVLVGVGHVVAAERLGVGRREAVKGTLLFFGLFAAWQALVSGLAVTGLLSRFDARPPPLLVMLVGIAGGAQWLARSSFGRTLGAGLPLAALVAFHAFRLPLELLMHAAALEGVMPLQMTWSGWNYDVFTGASAIVVSALVAFGVGGPRLVFAWNAVGTALLVTIVVIAVGSTPVFSLFGGGPALNTFIAFVPFTTLPTVMVLFAMAGHVVLWRRLSAEAAAPARQVQGATP